MKKAKRVEKEPEWKISADRQEELRELFKNISLTDVLEWWVMTYPDDIFVEHPKEIVQIRILMKKILKRRSAIKLKVVEFG